MYVQNITLLKHFVVYFLLIFFIFVFSMSSSFVADDTPEQKSDSQVVIVFDENGTVCLDEQTLQKLLGKYIELNYNLFLSKISFF